MRLLIDTNRLTDAFRGDSHLIEMLETSEEVWIPFVVLGELKAGFESGSRREANESSFQRLLDLPGTGVLFADLQTTDVYARLYSYLRRTGTPIPTNDLWIASLAVQHQLLLVSRDVHFDRLPQVAKA